MVQWNVLEWFRDDKEDLVAVDLRNVGTMKGAVDTFVAEAVMALEGVEEDFGYSNVRLVGEAAAVCAALASHFVDPAWVGRKERQEVVVPCLVAYALLLGLLQVFTWAVEQDKILVTRGGRGEGLVVRSRVPKSSSDCVLEVAFKGSEAEQLTRSFGAWFDTEGNLADDALREDVAALVRGAKARRDKKGQ